MFKCSIALGRKLVGNGKGLTEKLERYSNSFKYNCHYLQMVLSLLRVKEVIARKYFFCLLICLENRNRDVFIIICMVPQNITHQNVMPHMMRPKHKNVFVDNWQIDGNDVSIKFRKHKTKLEIALTPKMIQQRKK